MVNNTITQNSVAEQAQIQLLVINQTVVVIVMHDT